MTKRTCSIENCANKHYARGLCDKHYQRALYSGALPNTRYRFDNPEESFISRTKWQDGCLVWTGSRNKKGYGKIWSGIRMEYAHRYAWERHHGAIPSGAEIDHECWNTSCVNTDHLRLATPSNNNAYRSGTQINNKSGRRNVYPKGSKWQVVIGKDGKQQYFGIYSSVEEAAAVAEQARKDLFGDYAGRG